MKAAARTADAHGMATTRHYAQLAAIVTVMVAAAALCAYVFH